MLKFWEGIYMQRATNVGVKIKSGSHLKILYLVFIRVKKVAWNMV